MLPGRGAGLGCTYGGIGRWNGGSEEGPRGIVWADMGRVAMGALRVSDVGVTCMGGCKLTVDVLEG